jgi:hypothetical protein
LPSKIVQTGPQVVPNITIDEGEVQWELRPDDPSEAVYLCFGVKLDTNTVRPRIQVLAPEPIKNMHVALGVIKFGPDSCEVRHYKGLAMPEQSDGVTPEGEPFTTATRDVPSIEKP